MRTSTSTTKCWRPSTRDSRTTVVLGIDPGTLTTGYALVARTDGAMRLLGCGVIRNAAGRPLSSRLTFIYEGLRRIIGDHKPDECAIESAFYGKNAQSALKLGHARGVCMLAAVLDGLPLAEYSPREVKKAVVGTGTASKEQVQYMVKNLLGAAERTMTHDTSDAAAVAICHLHRMRLPATRSRDWKSYIAAHPERVRP
jgi:crossover junction endodeoxyribonuclease RuvC